MEHLLGPEGPRIRETVLLEAQLSHAALKAAERVGAPLAGLRSRGTGYRERLGSIPLDKQDPYAFVAHVRAVSELAIRALNRGQNQEVMKHLGPLLDVYELGDPRAPREIFGALNHPLVALMRQPDPSALGIGKERLVKLTQMHSMLARFSPEKHWSALFEDAYESDHVRISSELPLENPGSIPGFLEEMIQLAH
jgi:hypothetical protein